MGNTFINHCASHSGGGHQPPKSDKPEIRNPPKGSGVAIPNDPTILKELKEMIESMKDSGFHAVTISGPVISDLELKIRKKVLTNLEELRKRSESAPMTPRICGLVAEIQTNLELLWSSNNV